MKNTDIFANIIPTLMKIKM